MTEKTFDRWEFEELNRTFGLTRLYKGFPLLQEWMDAKIPIEPETRVQIERLRDFLAIRAEAWNEDELKFHFIAPLISQVRFGNLQYSVFTQRKMSVVINDLRLWGTVDFVIATGIQHPYEPFFFIHEYKQERKRDADPLGQLLAEILVANAQNHLKRPFYGAYVLGRYWFFVVFFENTYSVSRSFDAAAEDDIYQIFQMLLFVREKIENEFLPEVLAAGGGASIEV